MKYFKRNPHILLLVLIIIFGLFFRAYQLIDRFEFAHDGDLYSWIVKDIVVDGHLRLIGQLTTAPGIFIGPLFYYTLIPFFFLTNMDPVGAVIPIVIIGVLTVASYYWVFSRIWNKEVGLIASFLYAVLLGFVYFDRRVVPSTPTNIWLIWFFYAVMMIAQGRYFVLPILGFLVGLIWHIHIALLPILGIIPLAIFFSRKLPNSRQVILFFVAFLIPSIPLIVFELRHGFSQTISLISNFTVNHGGGTGFDKFNLITIYIRADFIREFFYPQGLPYINHQVFFLLLFLPIFFLFKKKILNGAQLAIFYFWILLVVIYYSISSVILSEYYLATLDIIFLASVALLLYLLYRSSIVGQYLTIGLLSLVLVKNLFYFVTVDVYHEGYNERKAVANFIAEDAKKNGFPCVAVSYITTEGRNVGFRYFFWLNGLHVNQPISGSPVYTIVLPPELVSDAIAAQFGHIGVLLPEKIASPDKIKESCSGQNANLTDPLFGFTK